MNQPKYKVGDWIRFYNMGKLVIDQVEYVTEEILGYSYKTLHNGSVSEDSIIDWREA